MENYKLIDDIDKSKNTDEYYCANIVEDFFKCNQKLIYIKGGKFGYNYRYCADCYFNWNNKKESKCLVKIL